MMEINIPYYEDNTRVSRSSLNWFNISPRHFRDKLDGKIPNDSSPAMDNGTMRHAYLLQFDEFKDLYRVLDFETPSSPQQRKFCQDYIDSKATTAILKASEAFSNNYALKGIKEEMIAAKGLEMALKLKSYIKWLKANTSGQKSITWAQFNGLKLMKENVRLHKKAKDLIFNNGDSPEFFSQNEFHINWEITIDGNNIPCKSLIDRLVIDHEHKIIKLIDIKTTMSICDFGNSFKKYDYGMQMAFYWMAIYWYCTNELKINPDEYTAETYIVAIENGSNAVKVFNVKELTIQQKATEIINILTNIGWHFKNNLWDYSREYYEGDGVEPLPDDIS